MKMHPVQGTPPPSPIGNSRWTGPRWNLSQQHCPTGPLPPSCSTKCQSISEQNHFILAHIKTSHLFPSFHLCSKLSKPSVRTRCCSPSSLSNGLTQFLSINFLPHAHPNTPNRDPSCHVSQITSGCLNLTNSTCLSFSCFIPSWIQAALIIPSSKPRMDNDKDAGYPMPRSGR